MQTSVDTWLTRQGEFGERKIPNSLIFKVRDLELWYSRRECKNEKHHISQTTEKTIDFPIYRIDILHFVKYSTIAKYFRIIQNISIKWGKSGEKLCQFGKYPYLCSALENI
jgi:hypothetical protein